jgi:TetR/AcrR family transcriptional regulator
LANTGIRPQAGTGHGTALAVSGSVINPRGYGFVPRRPHLIRVIDYEAARESARLAYLYMLMGPLNDAARPVFDRLVHRGTLRDMPWYLFHFAVTKPLAMYSQASLARLFGRPDDADDHTLMSTVVLNGLLR